MAEYFVAEGLHYRVAGKSVIADVSLALAKGELVALIGPNGAGKSTLLRLLTGFLKPATGRCVLAGKPLHEWSTQTLSRHRAVMRQQTLLGFDWPVEAVIAMGRAPWTQQQEPRLIAQVMEMTGCTPLAGRQYAALSGGEQQRVQLARALAQLWCDGAPRGWLFLDEPTSALDPELTGEVLGVMRRLADEGMTMLVVTHELGFAKNISSRTMFIEGGVVVEEAPSREFFANPTQERTKAFLRAISSKEEK